MKKLLGILVLGLLWCNSSNAFIENNLKGLKEFRLHVIHDGSCDGDNYRNDIITNVKYLLGNSKIELTESFDKKPEWLSISVLTVSQSGSQQTICSSTVELETYTFGFIKNAAGNKFYGQVRSYVNLRVGFTNEKADHKKQVMGMLDGLVKEFVVAWIEAQK